MHINNDFAKCFILRLWQIRMDITHLIRAIKESHEKDVALEQSRISVGKTERTIFFAEEGTEDENKTSSACLM